MSVYLIALGGAVLAIIALVWAASRWGRVQEKADVEQANRKAAERVAKAEADSPRDSVVLLDELRDGSRKL